MPHGYVEEAVVIPGVAPLVGTVTRPAEPVGLPVILLNAGLVNRAGPDGVHVRLAGELAAQGSTVLRVDYSGVGDSPARRDRTPLDEVRLLETRAVVDWFLADSSADGVVLAGICTGADNAFRSALADDRVAGVVLLDGYPYRTRGWWLRHYLPRVFRASSWRTLLRTGLAPPGRPVAPEDRPDWDGMARKIPSRAEMADQLRALIDRGTRLYFIYTGGFSDWVNHAGQLAAAFPEVPFGDRVTVEYLPDADHVFRPAKSQADLVRCLTGWLKASGAAV